MEVDTKISGDPTKELFVHILTRDLSLEDAINDLIDNSIDGAIRLKPKGDYSSLFIKIVISSKGFSIEDNCGGIDIDLARNYAFRFGRAKEMKGTNYSIGQFGVGMKRALFKLGSSFYINSVFKNSEFAMAVDIEDWLKKRLKNGTEDWSFDFNSDFKINQKNKEEKTGTFIEVTPLHDEIVEYINSTNFIDNLKDDIELTHMENIYKGINISVNDSELFCKKPEFVVSDKIKVSKFEHIFDNKVKVKILAGLGDPVEEDGGWYIFCNDRLLLGPNQEALTGWTGKGKGGVAKYHQQFYMFRGLVFFTAKNAKDLPWNTSKNDVDASAPSFLFTRSKMIEAMRPIIRMLNMMKKERESFPDGSQNEDRPLELLVKSSKKVTYSGLSSKDTSSSFIIPKIETKKQIVETVTITYKKSKAEFDLVANYMGFKKANTVGEKTFDYFVTMEELDDE